MGASAAVLLAVALGEPLPSAGAALTLFAIGATGYGLSLRYLLAQRAFGAARMGSVFAFAPFIGAALAVALGDRSISGSTAIGGVLMLCSVVLHLAESHDHEHAHVHGELEHEHEHAHRNDDGHHTQVHDQTLNGEHSHRHRHAPLRHGHAHAPDAHHGHRHEDVRVRAD